MKNPFHPHTPNNDLWSMSDEDIRDRMRRESHGVQYGMNDYYSELQRRAINRLNDRLLKLTIMNAGITAVNALLALVALLKGR